MKRADIYALIDDYPTPVSFRVGPLTPDDKAQLVSIEARYRDRHGETVTGRVPAELFAAELRHTHDTVALLRGLDIALRNHLPVPDGLAERLSAGIACYLSGEPGSLDKALDLKSPSRTIRAAMTLQEALGRMLWLHSVGATIDQAALLVARLSPEHKASTLSDRYKHSGNGALAKVLRATEMARGWDIDRELAAYPNGPGVKQAKDAIRKVYAKPRV